MYNRLQIVNPTHFISVFLLSFFLSFLLDAVCVSHQNFPSHHRSLTLGRVVMCKLLVVFTPVRVSMRVMIISRAFPRLVY